VSIRLGLRLGLDLGFIFYIYFVSTKISSLKPCWWILVHNTLRCHDISICIKIISTWWNAVNIIKPKKDLHKKFLPTAIELTNAI